jgi:hypothetical protein
MRISLLTVGRLAILWQSGAIKELSTNCGHLTGSRAIVEQ